MIRNLNLIDLLVFVSKSRGVVKYCFNKFAKILTGKNSNIDWMSIKVRSQGKVDIGDNFSAGRFLWLESIGKSSSITIGNNVNFSDFVHIGCVGSIVIGDGVLLGSSVLIIDHSHGETVGKLEYLNMPLPPNQRPLQCLGSIVIEKNVWVGDKVSIIRGITIGENAIVGAGSIVLSDIPRNSIWAGSPAKQIFP